MSQVALIVDTLKQSLRARAVTYAEVATHLSLSEASVKRMFSSQRFSLTRLDAICQLLGLELTDLMAHAAHSEPRIAELTPEQEAELAADLPLLLVFFLLLNDYRYEMILADYALERGHCFQLMHRLDQMGLIDLLPENRVRLKVSRTLHWRSDGPIRQFFDESIRAEFMRAGFDQPEQQFHFLVGMLSPQSIRQMDRRIAALVLEFEQLLQTDSRRDIQQRQGYSALLAVRNWQFSLFEDLKRPDAVINQQPPTTTD
ncbi:MAG: helix-turn-helix transcriptional regulator [Gammaproteobacteria bacterium]|nr:helix-turn-helix transcriptional regulator [Gammaproteobacteria bacterium]